MGWAALAHSPLLGVSFLCLPSSCSLAIPPHPHPPLSPTVTHPSSHLLSYSHIEFQLNAGPVPGLSIRLALGQFTGQGGESSPHLVRQPRGDGRNF